MKGYKLAEKLSDIKRGDEVLGIDDEYGIELYRGYVHSVEEQLATIAREDGEEGGGDYMEEHSIQGWQVEHNGECWGSDSDEGKLYVKNKFIANWKEETE